MELPSQKIASKLRTEDWYISNVDAFLAAYQDSDTIRASRERKALNLDLINGILHEEDIEKVFNPLNIKDHVTPSKTHNYPIELPYFNLLIGEELNRGFDWRVIVSDQDSIAEKHIEINTMIGARLMEEITNPNYDPQSGLKRLQKLKSYIDYEYLDKKEIAAQRILKYFWKNPDVSLPLIFNKGYQDVLYFGEEIYEIDIIQDEPKVRKLDPMTVSTIGGTSYKIEESDAIIIDEYISRGQAIDYYYDELTADQVEEITSGKSKTPGIENMNYVNAPTTFRTFNEFGADNINDDRRTSYLSNYFDGKGNIRRQRVLWKSKRKIGILTYLDEITGEEEETTVDENYKIDKTKGEKIEWVWVNEWLEATKLGRYYLKMQVLPTQYRKMNNLSECYPGIVGTIYNINSTKAMSMVDRIKGYKYLYNVIMKRTELAFAKHKGPIIELDLARIPDDNLDKWMNYAETMGYMVVDSAKEINKGVMKGKLSADLNTTGRSYSADMGNYIVQHIEMLNFIEKKIADICGIPPQRMGAMQSRETLGGIEKAIHQSSHITELEFYMHDNTKARVMHAILEVTKIAWNGKNKKLQYLDDGLINVIYDINGENFYETEYGVFVSNSTSDKILRQKIEQLAHAGLQNDKLSFSQILDIYSDESISSIRRKIEKSEVEAQERAAEAQQQQQEMLMAQAEAENAHKMADIESREKVELEKVAMIKYKAELDFESRKMDADRDGVPDHVELERVISKERIANDQMELEQEEREKDREFEALQNELDRKLKRQEMKIKDSKPKTKN